MKILDILKLIIGVYLWITAVMGIFYVSFMNFYDEIPWWTFLLVIAVFTITFYFYNPLKMIEKILSGNFNYISALIIGIVLYIGSCFWYANSSYFGCH
jgi:hypothetical protein